MPIATPPRAACPPCRPAWCLALTQLALVAALWTPAAVHAQLRPRGAASAASVSRRWFLRLPMRPLFRLQRAPAGSPPRLGPPAAAPHAPLEVRASRFGEPPIHAAPAGGVAPFDHAAPAAREHEPPAQFSRAARANALPTRTTRAFRLGARASFFRPIPREARYAVESVSRADPAARTELVRALDGVDLAVHYAEPTAAVTEAMHRVTAAVGGGHTVWFDRLLDGEDVTTWHPAEPRVYAGTEHSFGSDLATVRDAVERSVQIAPRGADGASLAPHAQQALTRLNRTLRPVRARFARAYFRLRLDPGENRMRAVLGGVGLVSLGLTGLLEHTGHAVAALTASALGDDVPGAATEAASEIRRGTVWSRVALEQSPTAASIAASVWLGDAAEQMRSGAAGGAALGGAVVLADAVSTVLAVRTIDGVDRRTAASGALGPIAQLAVDRAFQRDLRAILDDAHGGAADERPEQTRDRLVAAVTRHLDRLHAAPQVVARAREVLRGCSVAGLVARLRAPSFRARWGRAVGAALREAPERAGLLLASVLIPTALVAAAALTHGQILHDGLAITASSGALGALGLATTALARAGARLEYASSLRSLTRQ